MLEFNKPNIASTLSEDGRHGIVTIEPLERGYGITLGNSIRRVLLSSVPGTAVTYIRIDGALHEFSSLNGVREDVTEIVLNVKGIVAKLEGDAAVTGIIEKRGKKVKEISAFIVEKGTPGFSFGTKEKKMGIRGSATYELIFTDCRIPKENLLGAQGKGFGIAMHTLDGGRIGIAAQALGIAEGALESTIAYVQERKQFGRSIGAFQNTQFQIADMATKVEAAKMLVYKAAMAKATQKVYSVEAAMAKLYAAEVAMEVTTKAVQLHGGYGYTREYDVERMMRDAKITEIYEGTSEVQRMVISGALLK